MNRCDGTECGDVCLAVLGHQAPPSKRAGKGGGSRRDHLAREKLAPFAKHSDGPLLTSAALN